MFERPAGDSLNKIIFDSSFLNKKGNIAESDKKKLNDSIKNSPSNQN